MYDADGYVSLDYHAFTEELQKVAASMSIHLTFDKLSYDITAIAGAQEFTRTTLVNYIDDIIEDLIPIIDSEEALLYLARQAEFIEYFGLQPHTEHN